MTTTVAIEKLSIAGSDLLARVERLRKPFWNLLTMSLMDGVLAPRKSLSVSIERGYLWVIVGSKFLSKIRVQGFRKYTFEEGKYPNPESLASTLALAAKELKAPRSGISLSIPREWVMMRSAELPILVKDNIVDVIGYELDRLTPFSPENAYYDFKVLGETQEKLNVVVTAARADAIDGYLEALRDENLLIESVTINLSSLATFCAYMDGRSSFLCLEANALGYEGGIVQGNVLSSSFWGSFQERDGKPKADVVASAINPLLEEAKKQGLDLPIIVHSADETFNAALKQRISSSLRFLRDGEMKLSFPSKESAFSGKAIGTALESLWSKANGLNLLEKGLRKKLKKDVAVTIVLVIMLIAAWIPFVVLPLQREERRLEEMNSQIALRKNEVKKVETLRKEVDSLNDETSAINNFKERSPMALLILKELTTILPKDTWLTRTRITDTTVELEGYAKSASEILPKLEQSRYLKKVEFAQPTIRDPRMEADRFVIKMELEGFGNAEGEKPKDGKKK
jgi:Tfp pilus assembly protein PilN